VRVLGCLAACLVMTGVARADTAAERVSTGEELAKQGRLTEAIASFKAADKIEKRAKHACLIALAYIRRELWPQAEIFLTSCHERANAQDPVPDWVPLAEQQMKERLATAKVAAVHVRIVPTALASQTEIGVSSFEPDELFSPRTIHLPRGTHLITATVAGKEPIQQTIEVTDEAPREVTFKFGEETTPTAITYQPPPEHPSPSTPTAGGSKFPLILMGSGAAILAGGVAFHLLAFKPVRDDLSAASDAGDLGAYDELSNKFDSRRTVTIALYGIGGAVLIGGAILNYTVFKHRDAEAPRAAMAVSHDSALVFVEWQR